MEFYADKLGKWHTESGEYSVEVGSSSRDIRLEGTVAVDNGRMPTALTPQSSMLDWFEVPAIANILEPSLTAQGIGKGTELYGIIMAHPLTIMATFAGGEVSMDDLYELSEIVNGGASNEEITAAFMKMVASMQTA